MSFSNILHNMVDTVLYWKTFLMRNLANNSHSKHNRDMGWLY
jgi:hypothetical protein